MNDQQLGALIESWLKDTDSHPGDVGRSTAQIESQLHQTRQWSRWWPLPFLGRLNTPVAGRRSAGGFSMFSALKFVAAAAIVALFGGFLLVGVLTTPQDSEIAPAAVAESPSPMPAEELSSGMDAFPTGIFIDVDTGRSLWEFHADGTGLKPMVLGGLGSFTYAVDGDVITVVTLAPDSVRTGWTRGTGTYRWDYDGELLTFELIEDASALRVVQIEGTFRQIDDPREVMVATRDLDVGDSIRAWLTWVDAAEAGPDAYTSKADYVGHVAAVPIAKGQPITPDLLKLRPSE